MTDPHAVFQTNESGEPVSNSRQPAAKARKRRRIIILVGVLVIGIGALTSTPVLEILPARAAAASPTPSCTPVPKLTDPGLEASSPDGSNPSWTSTSTNFGTAICSIAACGTGSNGQATPQEGTYWAWFGGVQAPENATLSQKFTIAAGAGANLSFMLKVSKSYAPYNDELRVKVDGVTIATYNEIVADPEYTQKVVPMHAYGDGLQHTLTFEFVALGSGRASSFNVDEIELIQCGLKPPPTPKPCIGGRPKDGSLEQSNPDLTNPFWQSTSQKFGTAICSTAACGNGSNVQAVPDQGTYWAWFGGVEGPEVATLTQTMTMPQAVNAHLRFYMKVSRVYPPFTDTLEVQVDGVTVETFTEPQTEETEYKLRVVEVPSDGAVHTLGFKFTSPSGGKAASFNVDSIDMQQLCHQAPAIAQLMGDVAGRPLGDQRLRADDITLEREFIVGLATPREGEFTRADTAPKSSNGDGALTAGDLVQVKRYAEGLDEPEESSGFDFETLISGVPNSAAALETRFGARQTVRLVPSLADPGKLVVDVTLDHRSGARAAAFTLSFDPEVLSDPVVTRGADTPRGAVFTVNTSRSSGGLIGVLIDANGPLAGDTLRIVFDIVPGAGGRITSLRFADTMAQRSVANAQGDLLSMRFVDGEFRLP